MTFDNQTLLDIVVGIAGAMMLASALMLRAVTPKSQRTSLVRKVRYWSRYFVPAGALVALIGWGLPQVHP